MGSWDTGDAWCVFLAQRTQRRAELFSFDDSGLSTRLPAQKENFDQDADRCRRLSSHGLTMVRGIEAKSTTKSATQAASLGSRSKRKTRHLLPCSSDRLAGHRLTRKLLVTHRRVVNKRRHYGGRLLHVLFLDAIIHVHV